MLNDSNEKEFFSLEYSFLLLALETGTFINLRNKSHRTNGRNRGIDNPGTPYVSYVCLLHKRTQNIAASSFSKIVDLSSVASIINSSLSTSR